MMIDVLLTFIFIVLVNIMLCFGVVMLTELYRKIFKRNIINTYDFFQLHMDSILRIYMILAIIIDIVLIYVIMIH